MKYLGIKIDENLNWKLQIYDVAIKLNRENAVLSKLRYILDRKIPKSAHYAIFEPHWCYCSLAWAQSLNSIKRHFFAKEILKEYMYFRSRNTHTSLLFREFSILKLHGKIAPENSLFINKYFHKFLPSIFKNWFTLSSYFHTYSPRWSNLGCLVVPPHNTKLYGRKSVNISAIYTWNYLQNLNENNLFLWIVTK